MTTPEAFNRTEEVLLWDDVITAFGEHPFTPGLRAPNDPEELPALALFGKLGKVFPAHPSRFIVVIRRVHPELGDSALLILGDSSSNGGSMLFDISSHGSTDFGEPGQPPINSDDLDLLRLCVQQAEWDAESSASVARFIDTDAEGTD